MRIRDVWSIGSRYHNILGKKIVDNTPVYSNKSIRIGRVVDSNEIFVIDLSDAQRILMFGKAGAGKTYSVRSLLDRTARSKYFNLVLTDVKNEFFSSRFPVQDEFSDGLDNYEKPIGQKIVTLRPTFFKDQDSILPRYNYWFSIDISNITKREFMTLLNARKLSLTQQEMLELLYTDISKQKNFKLKDIDLLIDKVAVDYTEQQRDGIKKKFTNIKTNEFAEDGYLKIYNNLIAIAQKYNIAINMDGYDNYGAGSIQYPEVTLSILLKKIREGRKKGKLKECFIVVEEAPQFLGANVDSCFKDDLIKGSLVDRRLGITYLYIVQSLTPDTIPPKILNQCRYVFIPNNTDRKTVQKMLVHFSIATSVQASSNLAITLLRKAKNHAYSWIVLDSNTNSVKIIQFFPPLSNHLKTK